MSPNQSMQLFIKFVGGYLGLQSNISGCIHPHGATEKQQIENVLYNLCSYHPLYVSMSMFLLVLQSHHHSIDKTCVPTEGFSRFICWFFNCCLVYFRYSSIFSALPV